MEVKSEFRIKFEEGTQKKIMQISEFGQILFKLGQCCFKVAQIRGERHFLEARGCRFWEIFFAENFVKKTALADDLRFFETLVVTLYSAVYTLCGIILFYFLSTDRAMHFTIFLP